MKNIRDSAVFSKAACLSVSARGWGGGVEGWGARPPLPGAGVWAWRENRPWDVGVSANTHRHTQGKGDISVSTTWWGADGPGTVRKQFVGSVSGFEALRSTRLHCNRAAAAFVTGASLMSTRAGKQAWNRNDILLKY